MCTDVENKIGIWLEPSIQGGRGGIWFYSKEDDSVLAENYDYQEYNDEAMSMALRFKTQREFQTEYKKSLQSII